MMIGHHFNVIHLNIQDIENPALIFNVLMITKLYYLHYQMYNPKRESQRQLYEQPLI